MYPVQLRLGHFANILPHAGSREKRLCVKSRAASRAVNNSTDTWALRLVAMFSSSGIFRIFHWLGGASDDPIDK